MIHQYQELCPRFYFFIKLSVFLYIIFIFNGCLSIWYNRTDGPPMIDRPSIFLKKTKVKVEPLSKIGNKPYVVKGKRYTILKNVEGLKIRGKASWYGRKFHGKYTANGEIFDMFAVSAAHKHLPLPTYLKVTNLDNKKVLIVRVNDRGPFIEDRAIDLSWAAAKLLGMNEEGLADVQMEVIDPKKYGLFNRIYYSLF